MKLFKVVVMICLHSALYGVKLEVFNMEAFHFGRALLNVFEHGYPIFLQLMHGRRISLKFEFRFYSFALIAVSNIRLR